MEVMPLVLRKSVIFQYDKESQRKLNDDYDKRLQRRPNSNELWMYGDTYRSTRSATTWADLNGDGFSNDDSEVSD